MGGVRSRGAARAGATPEEQASLLAHAYRYLLFGREDLEAAYDGGVAKVDAADHRT
ncbi:MAG: hypothetical protein AVDCRST_MAG05-4624 [uncultured Rubrobacteraceae bacterium]|uniref:Uncharacterized protein n=1 Tax=uncultured Rubrobacteraceae bacterium TaxID=349277 RepID=A0A6J4TW77_9ACTN|nr:MAG: hypothetical protein AVDCRST_MAG05-4624 [uncultured Rubrobacteraceae bacterium]